MKILKRLNQWLRYYQGAAMKPMNPEVKEKWVTRLRELRPSRQGFTRLKQVGDASKSGSKMCCLGVLCEIAVEEGIIPKPVYNDEIKCYGYQDNSAMSRLNYSTLPREVQKWAQLNGANPLYRLPSNRPEDYYTLAELNDMLKLSFKEIADIIDEKF